MMRKAASVQKNSNTLSTKATWIDQEAPEGEGVSEARAGPLQELFLPDDLYQLIPDTLRHVAKPFWIGRAGHDQLRQLEHPLESEGAYDEGEDDKTDRSPPSHRVLPPVVSEERRKSIARDCRGA